MSKGVPDPIRLQHLLPSTTWNIYCLFIIVRSPAESVLAHHLEIIGGLNRRSGNSTMAQHHQWSTVVEKQREIYFAYYVTLFLDVLGQKRLINKLTKLPENKSEEVEVLTLLKDTVGFVRMLRENFEIFFRSAAELSTVGQIQPEKIKQVLNKLHEIKIIKQYFSDSFIFSVCLMERPDNKIPLSGLYNTIYSACFTQFAMLALGKPLRGGIDIGLSIEIEENEIYGRSLSSAYALERDKAKYPRIIVGNALLEMIEEVLSIERDDPFGKINKYLAQECKNLMFRDSDGNIALDYLSTHIKEHLRNLPKELSDLINFKKIEEFANKSLAQFASDPKLGPRYEMLLNYVRSRMAIWA